MERRWGVQGEHAEYVHLEATGGSPMIAIGVIEGEVLTYLEAHGATATRRLIRELEWPALLTTMAIGALIRAGLIRASQHDLEMILEPERTRVLPGQQTVNEGMPEVWGG